MIVQSRELAAAQASEEVGLYEAVDYVTGQPVKAIDGELDLFGDGSVRIVPTYGHTPGHQSVIVKLPNGREIFLAADCCYTERNLELMVLQKAVVDREAGLRTLEFLQGQRTAGAHIFLGMMASSGRASRRGRRWGEAGFGRLQSSGPTSTVCLSHFFVKSGRSPSVESFGRRQASESLRCPNRGSHGLSYGESCFALMVGKPGAAQKRTCVRADRLNLDRKSGRRKADVLILIVGRLLLGSTGASVTASRRVSALDRVGARPCRITAQVSRVRGMAVAARGADIGARTPR